MSANRKRSFKRSVMKLNIVWVTISIILLILVLFMNRTVVDMYDNTLHMYSNLSGFYSKIEDVNQNVKSYLYAPNTNNLEQYEQSIIQAKHYASKLYDQANNQTKWKFHLLENMILMHEKSISTLFQVVETNDASYAESYNRFDSEYRLITKTFTDYYNIVDKQVAIQTIQIESNEQMIVIASLLLTGIVIFVLLSYARYIVYSITAPIYTIINNMKLVKEGDYDLSEISNNYAEIDTLCIALEDMASKVKSNMQNEKDKLYLQQQLFAQEKENLKKDELLAQSELRMLQNQINPHFLFNTMNVIFKTAQKEQAHVTSDIVAKTSEVLRYALDNANHMSDLKSEIESIRNYIYIQEKRFQNRIRFVLEVDKRIPNIPLPGLLIQPLVENSVIHGLKDTMKDGEIHIQIYFQDKLYICVSDNGVGMDTLLLEKLVINDFKKIDRKNGLGLYNVIQRIRRLYGIRANVDFQSYEECGFEVCIEIEVDEDDYVSHISD